MKAKAYAKVNLALAVFPAMADGYHPIRGVFQSISLADTVEIRPAASDGVVVSNGEAPTDETNLGWQAYAAIRRAARVTQSAEISIEKRIPSGTGLGGGSADAAAVLGLAGERFGIDEEQVLEIAEGLGADVPFGFVGGTCLVEGRGERLSSISPLSGFGLALVVPPFGFSTPEVYRAWDALGGPEGPVTPDSSLPPALRGGPPIRNDLYPAALSLDERLGEWRAELEQRWGTVVSMTGSGSALFAYFPSLDEASDAAAAVDVPTRLAAAVEPVTHGWSRIDV